MRPVLIAAVAAACLLGQAARATTSPSGDTLAAPEPPGPRGALERALGDANRNDGAAVLREIRPVISGAGFQVLTAPEQLLALDLAGFGAVTTGDMALARDVTRRATAMPEADGLAWALRLQAALIREDQDDAVLGLTRLAQRWPSELGRFTDLAIVRTAGSASRLPDGDPRRLQLLAALRASGWTPQDPSFDLSALWRELVRGLLRTGDVAGAAEVSRAIDAPYVLIAMGVERAFDPVTQAAPDRFSVGPAMDRQVAGLRARLAAVPGDLAAASRLAAALDLQGRSPEALAVLDRALAAPETNDLVKARAGFDDPRTWAMDARSRVLVHLGRTAQAAAQLSAAAQRPEHGLANASQTINLGLLYGRMGRSRNALDVIARLDAASASPFGRMQAEEARLMARLQLGDADGTARALAFARAHAADAPGAFTEMLVLAGDLDGAARSCLDRLADPRQRGAALLALQGWRPEPALSPFDKAAQDRWLQLRTRPDVQAAALNVGRLQSYGLFKEPG